MYYTYFTLKPRCLYDLTFGGGGGVDWGYFSDQKREE